MLYSTPPPNFLKYADNYCVTAKKLILNVSKIRLRLIFSCALYLPRLFQKRIITKNSPRHIKSGTDAAGSKLQQVFRQKNLSLDSVHGRTLSNMPAGVFCTLLASTPPISICKKAGYIWQTVNLPRLFAKNIITKSKQHNFFINNQQSHKTPIDRKKIFRSTRFYIGTSYGLGQFNPIKIKYIESPNLKLAGIPKGCPLWQREEKGGGHRGRGTTNGVSR